jgi:hypothetical protein
MSKFIGINAVESEIDALSPQTFIRIIDVEAVLTEADLLWGSLSCSVK